MTLLITVFAAVGCTVLWYQSKDDSLQLHLLCYMLWGASIMWMVDAVAEYLELGAAYFTPALADMLNDLFLGASVLALALVIWLVCLLIKDPKGVVRAALTKKK